MRPGRHALACPAWSRHGRGRLTAGMRPRRDVARGYIAGYPAPGGCRGMSPAGEAQAGEHVRNPDHQQPPADRNPHEAREPYRRREPGAAEILRRSAVIATGPGGCLSGGAGFFLSLMPSSRFVSFLVDWCLRGGLVPGLRRGTYAPERLHKHIAGQHYMQ